MPTAAAPPSTAPPSAEQTGSYKRSARNYLLDSRFQLKYTGYLVGVALVISGVMGSVVFTTTRSMVGESQEVVAQAQKVSEESKKVSEVSRMNIKDLAADSPELLAEFNKEADEHDAMIAAQQKTIADQQAMLLHRQTVLIYSLVGGLALMVILIGLLGIYFTHKVAGPVFKMKRLLGQVGKGNLRVEARLRKGDELQDFFDAFAQMVANLRKFEQRQLDDVEKAMAAVDRGDKDEAKASLGRVRETMQSALEG
jgi:nitrogen fixation/metabolism regulation signal transduction histidine kinase